MRSRPAVALIWGSSNMQCSTRVGALALFIVLTPFATSFAANGLWIATTGTELWSTTGNWSGGVVANGADFTADFGTLNLVANNTVHLDSARTIGALIFGDTVPSNNWTLDNNG